MKRIPLFLLLALSCTGPFPSTTLRAEENGSELSLPWAAFQDLLKLGKDEVVLSWDEFQKLLAQTGEKEVPHVTTTGGQVILSRAEFKRLLEGMKTPPQTAERAYITQSRYTGDIQGKRAAVTARIHLQIPGKPGEIQPLKVPLFPASIALQEILVDGNSALIENDGSWMSVIFSRSGEHEITARFRVAAAVDQSPASLYFPIVRTPITRLELSFPLQNVDVQIANAALIETEKSEGRLRVTASLPASDSVSITWNPVVPEKEKGPAKIYADVYNLISIEDDALRVKTKVKLDILQNTVNSLNLSVPQGYTILDVQGEAVGAWEVRGQTLVIPFQYARKGAFELIVSAEKVLAQDSGAADFDGFAVANAVRERGFVGVELKSTAEAKIPEKTGLDVADIQELPQDLLALSQRPLVFGLKYLRHPYHLSLDIQKHKEVAVISTVADEANAVTLVLDDGQRVTSVTYRVRNSWKQFLELKLPEGSQVWSAFVAGQRVKPSQNDAGKILIPLNRSVLNGAELLPFDVEVMYYQGQKSFFPLGQQRLEFPAADVVVSQMLWSVYLPVQFDYWHFGGTVDKEAEAQGFKPFVSSLKGQRRLLEGLDQMAQSIESGYESQSEGDKMVQAKNSRNWEQRGRFDSAQGVNEESYARQISKELGFLGKVQSAAVETAAGAGGGDAGVLPIRIAIPNTGQVYRFTKRIIVDQTPLVLTAAYVRHGVGVLVKLILCMALLAGLWRLRFAVARGFEKARLSFKRYPLIDQWARTPLSVGVGALLAGILILPFFRFLGVLALLVSVSGFVKWVWSLQDKGGRP